MQSSTVYWSHPTENQNPENYKLDITKVLNMIPLRVLRLLSAGLFLPAK
jgi:hypothetical protein